MSLKKMFWLSALIFITLTSSQTEGCGNTLHGTSGSFTSPNYPSNYDNGLDCTWTIGAGISNTSYISVHFHAFHLEGSLRCPYDYVHFGNKDDKRICDFKTPFTVLTRSPVTVRMHTDGSVVYSGFYATYAIISSPDSCNKNLKLSFNQSGPGRLDVKWEPSSQATNMNNVTSVLLLRNNNTSLWSSINIINGWNTARYLEPGAWYSLQAAVYDSTNINGTLMLSCVENIKIDKTVKWRLVGGRLPNEGMVEVFYRGVWGAIKTRSSSWANVFCRSIGLPSASYSWRNNNYNPFFDANQTTYWMTRVYCNGYEKDLVQCQHDGFTNSPSIDNSYYRYQAAVVCGQPTAAIVEYNVTQLSGVLTSPGYPFYMQQGNYRWMIRPNISNANLVLYFEDMDLKRHYGMSYVNVQNINLVNIKRYSNWNTKKNETGILLKEAQGRVTYSSSFTSRAGRGFLARYLVYREPSTIHNNLAITESTVYIDSIHVRWSKLNIKGYTVTGYLIVCNSTQAWHKEPSLMVVANNSTSGTCYQLIGYTQYTVHVVVQLIGQHDKALISSKSSNTYITTLESVPTSAPAALYVHSVSAHTATIVWNHIPREHSHGIILGYDLTIYRNYNGHYLQLVQNLTTNNTAVYLNGLVQAEGYEVFINGFTAKGSGPKGSLYFRTRCGGIIKNEAHGTISISRDRWSNSIDCFWKVQAPSPDSMILIMLESLQTQMSFRCSEVFWSIIDGKGQLQSKLCGPHNSKTFISFGSLDMRLYSSWRMRQRIHMKTSFFVLNSGIENIPLSASWNISSTVNSSTSIQVKWEIYPGQKMVNTYVAVCKARNGNQSSSISAASTNWQSQSLIVGNLLPFTEYDVVVLAVHGNSSNHSVNWNETVSKSNSILITTDQDVPSGPPRNVTAIYIGSNTVVVNWMPVDSSFANGIITGYKVYYKIAWASQNWTINYVEITSGTKANLKGLRDVTLYRIEISALTKMGEGPRNRAIFIKTGCQQNLGNTRGRFSSPNYPSNYPTNADCKWIMSTSGIIHDEFVVIYESFDIEEGYLGACSNDYVMMMDIMAVNGNYLLPKTCGRKSPFAVVSSRVSTVLVLIKSDGGIEESGFLASYFLLNKNDKDIRLSVGLRTSSEVSLSWIIPSSASVDGFYVLYKRNEIDENWRVKMTSSSDLIKIGGLNSSTQYMSKIIANTTTGNVYWSNTVYFNTLHARVTPPPEETPTPTVSLQLMYNYGTSAGDQLVPYTWGYRQRCMKIAFDDDGFLFMTKRFYKIYICRNGIMRFGSSSYLHWPRNFGTSSSSNLNVLAPYWSLTDRYHAKVYYQVYTSSANTANSKKVLEQATNDVHYLKGQPLPSSFKATWVLVVTWDKLRHMAVSSPIGNLRNTFQAVLITDGVYSFAMYNYPTNGIQWSAPSKHWNLYSSDRVLPVVGWSTSEPKSYAGTEYFNIEKSGTVNIADIDDTDGKSVYRKRSEILQNSHNTKGKWFFELYLSWKVSDGERKCKNWFKKQPDPRMYTEYLEPCPCTARQAWWDERFTPESGWLRWWWWGGSSKLCAVSTFSSIDGWEQKCCYSNEPGQWGAIIVGHPGGGHAHRYSKKQRSGDHTISDVVSYQHCCADSNLCHLYYKKRPSDDCSRYEPPEWSWMWGDPHFVTLDGKNFTFNGLGEYIMLDARDSLFQLQSRTRLANEEGKATVFCAAVMKEVNCSTLQLELSRNGTMSVMIDGEPLDLDKIQNVSTRLNRSVAVSRPQENSFRVTYPSGISVTLTQSQGALSILSALPKSFWNQTKGLLGTWNGNKLDDFTTPRGYVVPANSTGRTIHFEFGQQWQVDEQSSLFTYNVNESVSTFSNASFEPMFVDEYKFDNISLETQALSECNGDINCLFDAASTNDMSVGLATKVVGSQMVNDSEILRNAPPRFPNNTRDIFLDVNTTKQYSITAKDADADSIRFNVSGLPTGAEFYTENSTVFVSWNVTMEKVVLEFVATDAKGAVAIFRPNIFLCACHNGAKCSLDNSKSQDVDRFRILPCQCTSGYTGQFCESDIDACKVNLNPCYPGVKCQDKPAPANETGYECGSCPSGYTGKGDSCQDIDECDISVDGCSHNCINTPGSFVCTCKKGFALSTDGRSCKDIDECHPTSDCMHKCENSPGSYSCSCNDYFKVDPTDSKKCIPKSPCKHGSHNCQHICYESNNVATCACRMGYELNSDKKSCSDIDECKTQKDRCNQLCSNNEGSYDCTCVEGFRLSEDNVTCSDINECIEWTFNCSASLSCENTIGSYNCRCKQGLYWIDGRCRELSSGETKPTIPPPPAPRTPSSSDITNTVNVTIKDLNVTEWDAQLDLVFKKSVALEVTTFCAKNDLCLNRKSRRERRSNNYITFTPEQVNLLPGFPIQSNVDPSNMEAVVAFYVNYPKGVSSESIDSINGSVLVTIIAGSITRIGKDIDKTVLHVSRYQTLLETSTKSTPHTTPSTAEKAGIDSLVLIVIIAASAALVLTIVLVVLISFCRKKQKITKIYVTERVEEVELNQYQDVIFFKNAQANSAAVH